MKLYTAVLLLSLAACGKASDLPAMRAETDGLVKNYQLRFDELEHRANEIMQRGNAIGVTSPDAANASRTFAGAKSHLDEMKGVIGGASADIAKAKDRLELQRLFDSYTERLGNGYTEINADFDAVESWIGQAEARPQQVSHNEPPSVPPPPVDPNAPPVE